MSEEGTAVVISIHALREEGDELQELLQQDDRDFYPRPPRGGRPSTLCPLLSRDAISIHALREEGDLFALAFKLVAGISIHALREEGDPLSGVASKVC